MNFQSKWTKLNFFLAFHHVNLPRFAQKFFKFSFSIRVKEFSGIWQRVIAPAFLAFLFRKRVLDCSFFSFYLIALVLEKSSIFIKARPRLYSRKIRCFFLKFSEKEHGIFHHDFFRRQTGFKCQKTKFL